MEVPRTSKATNYTWGEATLAGVLPLEDGGETHQEAEPADRDGAAMDPGSVYFLTLALTLSMSTCTIDGSARVDVSPSCSASKVAILRSTRRMILPERVLGRPGVTMIASGIASPPISARTVARREATSSALSAKPSLRITYAKTPCPLMS